MNNGRSSTAGRAGRETPGEHRQGPRRSAAVLRCRTNDEPRERALGARGGPHRHDGEHTVTCQVRIVDPRTVVAEVAGEIDLRTARALRTRLTALGEADFTRLIVDFAHVRFCDATGLGVLVAASNRIRERGGEIRLARVRPAQRRLFAVTGLDRLFSLHASVEDAADQGRAPTASPRR